MTKGLAWVLAALWVLPLRAAAQQPDGALRWRAPSGCPGREEIARVLPPEAARIELDGEIVREGRGYRLRLSARGQGHRFERTLRAATCEVLGESAVWLVELALTQLSAAGSSRGDGRDFSRGDGGGGARVDGREVSRVDGREVSRGLDAPAADTREGARGADARALDGRETGRGASGDSDGREIAPDADGRAADARERDARGQGAAAASESEYLSTGAPEVTHVPADDSGEGAPDALRVQLGLGAAATDMGLSGLTPHLALDVMLALADWSVGVRLGMLLHPELPVTDGAAVDLHTSAAQLLGCRLWETSSLRAGPCLGLNALYTSARTTGLRDGEASSAGWLTAGAALVLYVRIARAVLVGAELGGSAAISARPSFEVSGNTLAQAETLSGYARLAALYEIW